MRQYFDITLPFSPKLPAWPGEPVAKVGLIRSIEEGDPANVTYFETHVHFGTHLDAPSHFLKDGSNIETLSLDALIGPAYVVDVRGETTVTAAVLEARTIPDGIDRLICKTDNSALWDNPEHEFFADFVAISADGAKWIVDRNISLVGIDYLSVETYHTTEFATHYTLLGANVIAVEGLDLRDIQPGMYEMACLPMKIVGSDGAPTRVVLWRDN
jgi:arylformamidase